MLCPVSVCMCVVTYLQMCECACTCLYTSTWPVKIIHAAPIFQYVPEGPVCGGEPHDDFSQESQLSESGLRPFQ